MRSIASCLLFALALPVASRADPVAQDAFRPLEPLVGSCWKGAFPDGASTDEHCWDWAWKGKFLRDRHVVRGPQPDYAGETFYGWDSETKQLRFWYFTNAGFFTTGVMLPREGGAVFPETVVEGGRRRELETVMTRPTPDSYRVASKERTGDTWKELWAMDLKRVRAHGPAVISLSSEAGVASPAWFNEEMSLRTQGSGRWIADNRLYKSAEEPYDEYGVEWKWGIGKQSLVGRLFAIRGGQELADFWEYRLSWNARKGTALLEQWGLGGTYGAGEILRQESGETECVQVFHSPGAPDWASRHVGRLVVGEDRTQSERMVDGRWKAERLYVWRLQP